MNKVRIGIICPSEIAFRRFMPAIAECEEAEYIGISSASAKEWFGEGQEINEDVIKSQHEKALEFQNNYGGKVFNSYEELLTSNEVDAIYLPLPPALHFKWAKLALENNKHIFLEKPSTTSADDTKELVEIATEKELAMHENYMFNFHSQIDEIESIIESGKLGDVRLYRISFGFPRRASNDFRYVKALGGGALLDAGGYTIKLACRLLGNTAKITTSNLNYLDEFEVDMFGTATMVNECGTTAQITFGMDNSYKCDLEVWGSKACLTTGRILTAPAEFTPTATIKSNDGEEIIQLSADDTFKKSIQYFCECVNDSNIRIENYKVLIKQAELVDEVKLNG